MPLNCVSVRNLRFNAVIGSDAWGREGKAQPVVLSMRLNRDIEKAAGNDDVNATTSYSDMAKGASRVATKRDWSTIEGFIQALLSEAILWGGDHLIVDMNLPKSILHANEGYSLRFTAEKKDDAYVKVDQWDVVKGIDCRCIIGVNAHERMAKQRVVINLQGLRMNGSPSKPHFFSFLAMTLVERVETTTFRTAEALVSLVLDHFEQTAKSEDFGIFLEIGAQVEKPNAVANVDGCGAEMTRDLG